MVGRKLDQELEEIRMEFAEYRRKSDAENKAVQESMKRMNVTLDNMIRKMEDLNNTITELQGKLLEW